MRCQVCNKEDNELYDAFYNGRVISACRQCIAMESLSVIKKPTFDQLDRANQRATVHERMMKMSGLDKLNPISRDNEIAQRNLAKIKIPPKKQYSDILIHNYDWAIMMSRRRKKMTLSQLADLTHIPQIEIEDMEKGVLPRNFERNARIISSVLNIPLLREQEKRLINPPVEKEKTEEEILKETREKLFGGDLEINQKNEEIKRINQEEKEKELENEIEEENSKEAEEPEKEEIRREFHEGKFDFSKTEKLKNVTLNDLINMKRDKEKMNKMEKEFQDKRSNSKKSVEED